MSQSSGSSYDASGNANETIAQHQLQYIAKCKSDFAKSCKIFCIVPELNGKLQLSSYWLKTVYFMVPHLQFGDIICSSCKQRFKPDGWLQTFRRIQCVDECSFLLQYKYKCNCHENGCSAETLLSSGKFPVEFKMFYPFQSTKKMMVHSKLVTIIMSDSLTGKTFHEIGNTIAVCRFQNYLEKRSMYCIRHKLLYENSNDMIPLDKVSLEDFGSMDDPTKYNEKLQPTNDFLIELHNDYINERLPFIKEYNDNIQIHPVQSIDSTFNVGKRTHESVIDSGEGQAEDIMRRRSIGKCGLLCAMNATGEVSFTTKVGKSEKGSDYIECGEDLKRKCDKNEQEYPKFFNVDNAPMWNDIIKKIFPNSEVLQDIKHLINRMMEATSKNHPI